MRRAILDFTFLADTVEMNDALTEDSSTPPNEQQPEGQPQDGQSAAGERAPSSKWVGLGFLALLMIGFAVGQLVMQTGPEIRWLFTVDDLLADARGEDRRAVLVLYEPDCSTTAKHDRALFTKREVRETLANLSCARIELKAGDPLRGKYGLHKQPLMLLLDKTGREISRLEGEVSMLQFYTYIRTGE